MTGPTGDPYFSYDYAYVGNIESEEEALRMRGLYDNYAKSGFLVDIGDEATDIHTERHTEGSRRDYTDTRKNDDIDIPF